jgi:hypothetical protein
MIPLLALRFQAAVALEIMVLWVVTICITERAHRFGGTYCFHLGRAWFLLLLVSCVTLHFEDEGNMLFQNDGLSLNYTTLKPKTLFFLCYERCCIIFVVLCT